MDVGVSRRWFLRNAALSSVALAAPCASGAVSSGGRVRFCAFADIHFNPGVWPHGDMAFLEGIIGRALASKTDFTIHLGDFTHRVDRRDELDFIRRYNSFGQKAWHVLGNHDGERGEGGWRRAAEVYGMPSAFYFFDVHGWRFVVADPNYFLAKDGRFVHYDGRNFQEASKAGLVKSACVLPPEQVEWIRRTIDESPHPCVFLSHESVERRSSVSNGAEIRGLFREANARFPGKVRLVINGHHHCNNIRIIDGIVYLDLNSANFMYYARRHNMYPADFVKQSAAAVHTIAWTEPLSAVITLDGPRLSIEGSSAAYCFGVTPEAAGYGKADPEGRLVMPAISSFEIG